jgi:hypothetical protein
VSVEAPPLVAPKDDVRAAAGIRRAKAWCGLIGFGLAGFSAWAHGDLFAGVLERALVGGIAGWLVGWAVALAVWRRILRAETRHAIDILRERAEARTAAAEVAEQ